MVTGIGIVWLPINWSNEYTTSTYSNFSFLLSFLPSSNKIDSVLYLSLIAGISPNICDRSRLIISIFILSGSTCDKHRIENPTHTIVKQKKYYCKCCDDYFNDPYYHLKCDDHLEKANSNSVQTKISDYFF